MELVDFIYASDIARGASELQALFVRFIADFGLEYFLIVEVSLGALSQADRGIRMTNFPETWVERYKKVGYADCVSIYREYRRANRPPALAELTSRSLPSGSLRILEEALALGIESGAALTLYGPDGRHFIFVVAGRARGARLDEQALTVLRVASFQVLTSFIKDTCETRARGPRLTEREIEVLCLIAEGKSKREVAELLSVSEASVKRHCERVFEKLGANSLAQAVSKAMRLDLIDPDQAETQNDAH
jgi:LuxR family transcriptional regulator, quorum-sensing system regulator BjaR1